MRRPAFQTMAAGLLALRVGFGISAHAAAHAPLADAAEAADRTAVQALLRQHADVNQAQADGMTALHWAVRQDQVPLAQTLLHAGAAVAATNQYGITPLSLACQNGSTALVTLLLAQGADPNATLPGGETVLMTAARTGRTGPVAALLQRGADVHAKERRGQTALMWAAAEGQAEVVQLLLQAGARLDEALPDSGFTALLFAAREGRREVVRALLEAGGQVNAVTQPRKSGGKMPAPGTSALLLAVENGHYALALDLVRAGADPNDQRSGFAPLHVLSWVRKPPRGEDFGAPPPPELTGSNSLQFVRALVQNGANVNARLERGRGAPGKFSPQGTTPFFLASSTADVPFMKLLLELGADPAITNAEGCTPLIAACGIHVGSDQATEVAGEEPEVLEAATLLLQRGADPNAVDANGETAMHGAALKNLPRVVQLLADHGAKPAVWNTKNRFGSTPLMLAQGYRPGNFKPSQETIEAIQRVLLAAGVPLSRDDTPQVLRNSDWEPLPAPPQKRP